MITPHKERTIDTIENPNKTQFTSEPNSINSQAYAANKNYLFIYLAFENLPNLFSSNELLPMRILSSLRNIYMEMKPYGNIYDKHYIIVCDKNC